MSEVTTHNFVNIDDRGHMTYETNVVFHGESESAIRISVALLDFEIDPWMYSHTRVYTHKCHSRVIGHIS
jgi:hypothetical protein